MVSGIWFVHFILQVVVLFGAESLAGGSPGNLELPSPRLSRIREVIFVRPNFRMGVLGYLAASALSNSTYPFTSGNYGLQDVVEALRWIQMNIVHFAGDPKAVTVMGHRAGATMLTTLLAMHKVEVDHFTFYLKLVFNNYIESRN